MPPGTGHAIGDYLLSLPERLLRSTSALAGGLVKQIGDAALPAAVRRTRLYRSMVEAVLRFLVEQVGEVEGVFPSESRLAEDFLMRRTAGNGLELIGILTFRASPVWVLAALADVSGAGRKLISEIAASLREEGLIAADSEPGTVNQILDALEESAGRAAETINTPPLNINELRAEWSAIQRSLRGMAPDKLPGVPRLEGQWRELQQTARDERRSVFELGALVALDTLTRLPDGFVWAGRSAGVAARRTGEVFVEGILEHYSDTLEAIRQEGLAYWWMLRFRPYLAGAARQFSPRKGSWTQRFLGSQRKR